MSNNSFSKIIVLILTYCLAFSCQKNNASSSSDSKDSANDKETANADDSEEESETTETGDIPEFEFTFPRNISAAGFKKVPVGGPTELFLEGDDPKTNFYGIDDNSEISAVGKNLYIGDIVATSGGLLMDISVITTQAAAGRFLFVKDDGSYQGLDVGFYVGKTTNGIIVFDDAQKFTVATEKLEPLLPESANLFNSETSISTTRMSGDYVVISSSEKSRDEEQEEESNDAITYTLLNVATGETFPGPMCDRVITLTSTKVHLNCSSNGEEILDTLTGERTATNGIAELNHQFFSHDRIIGLKMPAEDDVNTGTHLVIADADLNISTFDSISLSPIEPQGHSQLDTENGVLYASQNYVGIIETSGLSLIEIASKTKTTLFEGLTPERASMSDHAIYAVGTDAAGEIKTGEYVYETMTTTYFEGEDAFERIEAVQH